MRKNNVFYFKKLTGNSLKKDKKMSTEIGKKKKVKQCWLTQNIG